MEVKTLFSQKQEEITERRPSSVKQQPGRPLLETAGKVTPACQGAHVHAREVVWSPHPPDDQRRAGKRKRRGQTEDESVRARHKERHNQIRSAQWRRVNGGRGGEGGGSHNGALWHLSQMTGG